MLKIIKDLEQEVVEFTRKMIKIPSVTGEEEELANVIFHTLEDFGADEAFIDGIGNVIGIIRGKENGPNILLNGHLDTVPAGKIENWHGYHPFGAEIDDNANIHGRGASDCKGGLAAHIYTIKLLKALTNEGLSLKGNLIFSAVVHEEPAGMFGMEYLCKNTLPLKNIECDVVFLCEPTNLNVVIGQRGKVEIVVKTKGKTAHSSNPSAGINALEKMTPVLVHIFQNMNKTMNTHPLIGDSSITVTNVVCRPGTFSMIPDECEISIDRRYLPGEKIEDLLKEFEQLFEELKKVDPQFEATVCARKFIETSYTGYEKEVQKYHPPWMTAESHPFVQKTLLALKKIGQNPQIDYWKSGTDGSLTAGLMEIPTIGYSGLEERYVHTPEDRVNIEMMMQSLEGYFSIICELLGVDVHQLENQ